MITLQFFEHIKKVCEDHYGGFKSCHERLGYSSEAFYRTLARSFESYKVNFLDEDDRMIKVQSRRSSAQDESELRFTLTR